MEKSVFHIRERIFRLASHFNGMIATGNHYDLHSLRYAQDDSDFLNLMTLEIAVSSFRKRDTAQAVSLLKICE